MRIETERKMKRWREQRWILDQVIQTRGIDWDQGRTGKIIRNCGPGVERSEGHCRRIKKFVDIPREFSQPPRAAKNRGNKPKPPANSPPHAITTTSPHVSIPTPCGRFMRMESPAHSLAGPKRACYDKFIQFAGRPIERVELPTRAKKSRLYLHLPPNRNPGKKFPASCTSPAWTASKRIIRPPAIRFSNEVRAVVHRLPRPRRDSRRRHRVQRVQRRGNRQARPD